MRVMRVVFQLELLCYNLENMELAQPSMPFNDLLVCEHLHFIYYIHKLVMLSWILTDNLDRKSVWSVNQSVNQSMFVSDIELT